MNDFFLEIKLIYLIYMLEESKNFWFTGDYKLLLKRELKDFMNYLGYKSFKMIQPQRMQSLRDLFWSINNFKIFWEVLTGYYLQLC